MYFGGKSFSKETEEHFASMEATWETDKNELSLADMNIYIHRKPYKVLSVGYHFQTLEIFSDLVPLSLDIMDALLKDCFVFTHIYNTIVEPKKSKMITYAHPVPPQINPTFAKSYIASLSAHNWQDGEYFYNGTDSFVTFTKEFDRPTMKTFYEVIDGGHHMIGLIYGFKDSLQDMAGNDYATIIDFLSKDKHDILMLLVRDHVNLHINLNSTGFSEEKTIQEILDVCNKHGKNLKH